MFHAISNYGIGNMSFRLECGSVAVLGASGGDRWKEKEAVLGRFDEVAGGKGDPGAGEKVISRMRG